MWIELLVTAVTLSIALLLLSMRKFNYWKNKNVKYLKPLPLLGNYADKILLRKNFGEQLSDLCKQFPDEPMFGAFYGTEPVLLVQGLDLIQLITMKDHHNFRSREIADYAESELFNISLNFASGDIWTVVRKSLAPLFTNTKLKSMFPKIENSCKTLEQLLDKEVSVDPTLDMKPFFARYTMDTIISCLLGIDSKTMTENTEENVFARLGRNMFITTPLVGTIITLRHVWPSILYGLGLSWFPKETYTWFDSVFNKVTNARNNVPSDKNDMVDHFLTMKSKGYLTAPAKKSGDPEIKVKVDQDLLVAQCVGLFAAGFETTSSTLAYTLYELAKHPAAMQRVVAEVDAYVESRAGGLAYDSVTELPYLEQCIDEVLRLYSVLPVLTREVTEDYTLPNGVKLDRGLRIHIPVHHLHMNPKYFPEPEEFKPERFSPENVKEIAPGSYLPFGYGHRLCIGLRFAKMQMYSCIITILKKYQVRLAPTTPRRLRFESSTIMTINKDPIKLTFVEREDWRNRVFA